MSVGVDIHDCHEIVAAELRVRDIENFSLLQCDGMRRPCRDSSIDVAYSFIVFQHLGRIAIGTPTSANAIGFSSREE